MELLDIQPYLLFLLAGASLITAIITGGKYFYNRYTTGLDKRIDGCIKSQTAKNIKKITNLERKIELLIKIVVPARKRDLLRAMEIDDNE
jgi:hypothetical protein